ncbi:histidine kinase [Streptomyces monticola]|uniref:Histidine kinase n=1 Tax=Streptomyces monticola TaxID=2666263 RepID=A0ABW2JGL7_9ACTN
MPQPGGMQTSQPADAQTPQPADAQTPQPADAQTPQPADAQASQPSGTQRSQPGAQTPPLHGQPPPADSSALSSFRPARAPGSRPRTPTPGSRPRTPTPGSRPRTPTPVSRPAISYGPAPEPVAASALADDAPAPSLPIQLNALQALCRQVFGFRLAMIIIGAPLALSRAEGRFGSVLVGAAVVFSLMGSYAMLRDWERLGPLVLRHRWLMGIDLLFGAVLLLTASPDSTLGYATVCTPLLAGLLYGWRGAGIYTGIQIVVLVAAFTAWRDRLSAPDDPASPASTLLISGFCVAAGIIGVTLRNLMFRFGTATQALSEANARLAVTDAVEAERARLAREMHDSVAKTLHGVALSADALATSADRMDPLTVKHQAGIVARSARRAAAESRELLADLRRRTDYAEGETGSGVDIPAELAARVEDFRTRTGVVCDWHLVGEAPVPLVPHAVARQLLTVATEALENAHRHAEASHVTVELGVTSASGTAAGDLLHLNILDNGKGLPPGTNLEELRRSGHFGLVGMVERAASVGARIRIGRGHGARGTEVRVDLPLSALNTPTLPTPPTTPPSP